MAKTYAVWSERWAVCMTASSDADYYDEEPHVWQIVPSRPRLARTIKRYVSQKVLNLFFTSSK